jgi:uncharacterized protein
LNQLHERTDFPQEVIDKLRFYVYRLLDPRNGETFYVGKGTGNRIFAHIKGEISSDGDNITDKLRRIREIQNAGLSVQHVIHRHGLDSANAFEVEGALIDAYSGISNVAGGHANNTRGTSHAIEIVQRYCAPEVLIDDKVVEINVRLTSNDKDLYDATRFAWKLSESRALKADFALAVKGGLILAAYEIEKWLPATKVNFPEFNLADDWKGRFGFIGKLASEEIQQKYVRKKVPSKTQGAANPVRYHNI